MNEEKRLPEYLKGLRRACGYKQDFVASQLNITRQTYSYYETGRIKPPVGKLYRLAKLYGVSVEGMLSYEESCSSGEKAKQREAEKIKWKLFPL